MPPRIATETNLGGLRGGLACGVSSEFLDEEVARRMQSRDPGIRRRATWVAEAAISAGKA
jgi:hypothetical protein